MADDMQVYITKSKSLARMLNLIDEYGKFSGLRLNRNKTEGLKFGKWKNKTNIEHISQLIKPIKALKISFGGDCSNETNRLNWDSKLDKIENMLNVWSKRHLSVSGKPAL